MSVIDRILYIMAIIGMCYFAVFASPVLALIFFIHLYHKKMKVYS